MTNKERLIENNEKIKEIRETLARKQVSPTDMLQARVDQNNSCKNLFYGYEGTNVDFAKNLDTSRVTDMRSMFKSCKNITNLDLSWLDTSNVELMGEMESPSGYNGMFYECEKLESLNLSNWDTSKVTNMANMFAFCKALKSIDLSNLDTSNVTDMYRMFYASVIESFDLSKLNTSKVTEIGYMFGSTNITEIDFSDVELGSISSLNAMFYQCKQLETVKFTPKSLKERANISMLCGYCTNLKNVIFPSKENTIFPDGLASAFSNCTSLETIDMSGVRRKGYNGHGSAFSNCTNLKTVYGWDLIDGGGMSNTFSNCTNLTNLTLFNIQTSLTLGSGTTYGTLLTNESLIHTFKELWDLTDSPYTPPKLTLSTTSKENIANIYVKLITPTQEQIDADPYINNKKPCVVCEPTDEGAMTLTEYATSKNWAIA